MSPIGVHHNRAVVSVTAKHFTPKVTLFYTVPRIKAKRPNRRLPWASARTLDLSGRFATHPNRALGQEHAPSPSVDKNPSKRRRIGTPTLVGHCADPKPRLIPVLMPPLSRPCRPSAGPQLGRNRATDFYN
jgi:hypothetical protein